ncbi:MAG: biotin/lipoyl-containing protein [Roseovarius sp.]
MSENKSTDALGNDQVDMVLKLLDRSDLSYVSLEIGNLKVVASKTPILLADAASAAVTPSADAPVAGPVQRQSADETGAPSGRVPPPATPRKADSQKAAPAPGWSEPPEGEVAVRAPTLGTYYGQPSPGADPFVKVGQSVANDQTVCLVEVMKMFNSVTARAEGEVTRILCNDGEMVEHGQPLLFIRPTGQG